MQSTPIRLATTSLTKQPVARTRPLPQRKQILFAAHHQLLSSSQLVLFLRPGDFTDKEYKTLRAQLAALSAKSATASSSSTPDAPSPTALKLTVLRPGLLPALLRSDSFTRTTTHLATPSHLSGPLAVLTSPTLDPPTLSKLLPLLQQFSQTPSANAPPPDPKAKKGSTPVVERLGLLSSLMETRAMNPGETAEVAKLPSLDVLRAQIVGLLSAPGSRITGVLGAKAREVGRTVEGFKVGLEQANAPAPAKEVEA